jgi:hypothetical protein
MAKVVLKKMFCMATWGRQMKYYLFLALALTSTAWGADVYVHGYTRSNGTYVEPYHRSAPDNTQMNNYSTQGNVNPYTGQQGTRQPTTPSYPTYQQPNQQSNGSGCAYGQRC